MNEMSNETLKSLQEGELEILKKFIEVCEILHLRYFLDSGTLLGAIRHEGFIPWDDDIDVTMPRPDYEVFLEKGQQYLGKRYFVQTNITDPEYTNTYAKIRDSETTFIESAVKNRNINHGLYIDIFPYDGYETNRKIRNFLDKKIEALLNIQIMKYYTMPFKQISFKERVMQILSDCLFGSYTLEKVLQRKEKIHKRYKYEDKEIIKCFSYFSTTNITYDKKTFGDGIIKKFEKLDVKVPEKFDKYLTIMYGDYKKLPPIEKQKPHHDCEIIDINKSYKEYIKGESKCKD